MKLSKLVMCILVVIALSGLTLVHVKAEEGITATEATAPTDNTIITDSTTVTDSAVTTTDTVLIEAIEEVAKETSPEEAEEKEDEKEAKDTKKDKEKKTEDKSKESKKSTAKKYSEADLRLLSALVYCEAGSESYNGKLAVAIVVMNRKSSSAFPNTVKGVIYQKYQFGPARNGSLKAALRQYDAGKFTSSSEKACIRAAKAALSGEKTISVSGKEKNFSKYLYFSGSLKNATFRLGNHEFK